MDATISRTALLLAAFGLLSVLAFDRDFCEFATTDYSLEWAYEPQSENAVFVLKLNTTKRAFWTGVGFNGSRKAVDFVGILVRNHQVALADAYINSSGVLYTDVVSNVRTIGHEYDGEHLLVKFARPLVSPDMNNDQSLDGCVTFLLPRQPGDVESHGIRPHLDEFHRFKVCDIRKHCEIQMTQEKPIKKPKEEVKFAKSVDVSGLGDPCSFANENYVVNWTYAKPTDTVHFTMKFPLKSGKWWSAVGIGDTMADMDIGVIFVESGKAKKIGDYLSSSYGVPDQDDHEDWKLEGSTQKNGMVELRFSRKVETDDKKDRTMDGCVLFQFAANGGRYGENYAIHKHNDWPDLYKACDLWENCAELSFEKRAKNRKNKQQKDEEEEAPATDENHDESGEQATTPTADKPADAPTDAPAEAPAEAATTQQPPAEEKTEEKAEEKADEKADEKEATSATPPAEAQATTAAPAAEAASSKDDPQGAEATTHEPSEISEEAAAGSGEELPATTGAPSESSSEANADISLESSGQEPASQESQEQTTAAAEVPTTVAAPQQPPEAATPEVQTSAAPSAELTTPQAPSGETTAVPPAQPESTEAANTTPAAPITLAPAPTETPTPPALTNATSNTGATGDQCDPQKEDLAVCQSYMDNYMVQVREWAARHNEPMEAQYGKACALLSAVPHVPSLCCHIYSTTCKAQVAH